MAKVSGYFDETEFKEGAERVLKDFKNGHLSNHNPLKKICSYLLIIMSAIIVYIILTLFSITLTREIMGSIAQVNATIFAIAFTIPLAATQLARYQFKNPIFSGFALGYMILYAFVVFLPFLIPAGFTVAYNLMISVSFLCLLFLIPYLIWIKESLEPSEIISNLQRTVISSIDSKREGVFKHTVDMYRLIVFESLSLKDYGIFELAFSALPKLLRYCYMKKFILSSEPIVKRGDIYLQNEMLKIAESAINDRTALRIITNHALLIDSKALPLKEGYDKTWELRFIENIFFRILARHALDHKNKLNTMHAVVGILKSVTLVDYQNNEIQTRFVNDSIQFLISLPKDVIDWAYSLIKSEYGSQFAEDTTLELEKLEIFYSKYLAALRHA